MTDDLIGKHIGGYEIHSVIGRGGMATVYLARQQSMDRHVAMKMLPLQFAQDDMYLQRFEREVRIVSQLEHRNIVPVYDYGEQDNKQPFIVMRYMPAGSVDDLVRQGPLALDKILAIIAQIAPALDYAHSKGVLHRDLKPSNVLLDEAGGAFITDFGIARILGVHGGTITTQGVVGTPSYMSPEQAQGKPLDGRSDVYALGVMLFEMATGRRPFESDTPYSIAVMQVTHQPPAPRSIHPGVPMAVEKVILKALRKDPNERYPTAETLYEALKMAIERPDSVFDTEPNLSIKPDANADDTQPNAPSPPQPLPVVQAMHRPPTASEVHLRSGALLAPYPKRKRGLTPIFGVVLGGLLGCGLLSVLAIVGYVVVIPLLLADPTPNPSEAAAQATLTRAALRNALPGSTQALIPTLDPTSEGYRQTLIARTASAEASPSPTRTLTGMPSRTSALTDQTPLIAPVGVRGTPELSGALRGASGSIVYTALRPLGEFESFELILLELPSWTETQLTADLSDNSYPVGTLDGDRIVFQSNRDDDGDDADDFDIYSINRGGGQLVPLTRNTLFDRLPAWSPDGEWVAYSSDTRGDGSFDLYRVRADGTDNQVLLSNNLRASHPRYHPDGERIVFTLGDNPNDARTWEIAVLEIATGDVDLLTTNYTRDASPSYSPDGSQILYIAFNGVDNAIAIMDANGDNQRILFDSGGNDFSAAFSPDGRYIVFSSDMDGSNQLYLMTADGANVQQITSAGGLYAHWVP